MILLETLYNNLRSDFARQAVMNGNFDVWQRGFLSGTIADSTATPLADRWYDWHVKDGGTLPTLTRGRTYSQTLPHIGYTYISQLTTNGAGSSLGVNSRGFYYTKIEHGTRYLCGAGKTVTLSFYARSSIANKKIGAWLQQSYGSGGSPSATETLAGTQWTLTSTWQRCEVTFTTNTHSGKTLGTDNNDTLNIYIQYMWGSTYGADKGFTGSETYVGSGTIDIACVQLNAGSVALPFYPKTFDQEYDACQRYYQKSFNYNTAPSNSAAYAGADARVTDRSGTYQGLIITFPKKMRTTPTVQPYTLYVATANRIVDVNNSANQYACYVAGQDERGCIIESSSSIPLQMLIGVHWTADADLS